MSSHFVPTAIEPNNVESTVISVIREHYQTQDFIPLHAPCIGQHEKHKLNACVDSTFVSSVGQFVTDFENQFIDYTGAQHAIAVVNGTMGLMLALRVLGVAQEDLVLTQSLTFVATANAISMLGAKPIFLDVDTKNYGLSAKDLKVFLAEQTYQKAQQCFHKTTHQRISACVPMHTLGFAADIEAIVALCHEHNIKVVEDAAESLGSWVGHQHTGTLADIGVFSFNGNKIITTGGGGMLVTNHAYYAEQAKHLSTTAKIPHAWFFEHDAIAYNLRMPNLNAALGVAQFEQLVSFLAEKNALHQFYQTELRDLTEIRLMQQKNKSKANFWLNGLIFDTQHSRDQFLHHSNQAGIQTRPLWTPMHQLDIYKDCLRTELVNTEWLAERIVNIPSGVKCAS